MVNNFWIASFNLFTVTYYLFTETGGPDKSRTCDLVLIRDAL